MNSTRSRFLSSRYQRAAARLSAVVVVGTLSFVIGNRVGDAAPSGTPRLCYDAKGTVKVRSACRPNETEFSAMPGQVIKRELPAQTIQQGTNALAGRPKTPAVPVVNVSTLDILSTTARVYTKRIRFPAGTPIGTRVTSVTDLSDPLDPWNQTAVLPNCPLDAPMTIASTYFAQVDQNPNFLITEEDVNKLWVIRTLENGQQVDMPFEFRTYDWYLANRPWQDENELLLEVVPFNWNGGSIQPDSILPWDVDFYVSRTCAPIVSLEAAG